MLDDDQGPWQWALITTVGHSSDQQRGCTMPTGDSDVSNDPHNCLLQKATSDE